MTPLETALLNGGAIAAVLLVLFLLRILWHAGSLLAARANRHDAEATALLEREGLLRDVSKRQGDG